MNWIKKKYDSETMFDDRGDVFELRVDDEEVVVIIQFDDDDIEELIHDLKKVLEEHKK